MGMTGGTSQLPTAPGITAAMCTRDRTRQLRRALQSLICQTHPLDEVLVVDSRPTGHATADMIMREFPGVRYFREDAPGIGFARDRALREACHEIVAFLDDDAVARADWAAAIQAAMSHELRPAACTGRVEAYQLETPAQQLFEANGGFDRGVQRLVLKETSGPLLGRAAPLIARAVSIGSGCSMALDRRVALTVGGFDGAFGADARLPGGEDLDLLWRLLDAGHLVTYEPSVRAFHEHRSEMDALAAQLENHQRNLLAMLSKAAVTCRVRRRVGTWLFLGWRLLKPGLRLLLRLLGYDRIPAAILMRMWRGAAGGPLAYYRVRCAARGDASRRSADAASAIRGSP